MKPKHYILSLIILTIIIFACRRQCVADYYTTGMNVLVSRIAPDKKPPEVLEGVLRGDTIPRKETALELYFSIGAFENPIGCNKEFAVFGYVEKIEVIAHKITPTDTLKENITNKMNFYIPYIGSDRRDYYENELYKYQGKLADIPIIKPPANQRILLTFAEPLSASGNYFFTVYYEDSEQNVYRDTTLTFYVKN